MNEKELKRLLSLQAMQQGAQRQQTKEKAAGYEAFSATELYCPTCKQSMPVKEKMLLALPSGDLFDYCCSRCGTSLGTRQTG